MVKKGGVELILRGIGQLGPPWTGNDGLFALIDEIPSSGRNYAEVAFILITPISVDGYTFAQTDSFHRRRKSLHKRHLRDLM